MKILFLIKIFILSLFLLSGCQFGGGQLDHTLLVAASERDDHSDKRLKRRRRESSGAECREYRDCEDICEEVYNDDGEEEDEGKVETCLEVRYRLAVQFEDILEILEEPYESSLRNIEEDALFEFLDVSLKPWVEITDDVRTSEAEALLIWIAKNQDISQAIVDAYRNYEKEFNLYEGVYNLFDKLPNTEPAPTDIREEIDIGQGLVGCDQPIVGSDRTFIDIATDNSNATAIQIYEEVCIPIQEL